MSFLTEILRKVGGFDAKFRYHQDETDACSGFCPGYMIVYEERLRSVMSGARDPTEGTGFSGTSSCDISGTNDAYLVHKNFGENVAFPAISDIS